MMDIDIMHLEVIYFELVNIQNESYLNCDQNKIVETTVFWSNIQKVPTCHF